MAIVSRLPASPVVYDDSHTDFGITEPVVTDLVRFVHQLAWTMDKRFANAQGTVCFEEYLDRGVYGLERAWRSWRPERRLPFHAYARSLIFKEMLHATERYRTWKFPGADTHKTRRKPRAEHVRPLSSREVTERQGQVQGFRAQLARHQRCFTPQALQTLTDTLADLTYSEIAARDGITIKNATQRYGRLLRFLRTHVIQGHTSWHEEQRKRVHALKSGGAIASRMATMSVAAAD